MEQTIAKPIPYLSTRETVTNRESQDMRDLFIKTHQHAASQMKGELLDTLTKQAKREIRKGLANPTMLMAQHPNRLFLIHDGDQIVAYCHLLHHDDQTVELKNLVCSPERQGEGLGRRLMDAVEHHAHQNGYHRITLWTYSHLQTATSMYVKRGYQHTGQTPPRHQPMILEPFHMSLDLCTAWRRREN